MRKNRAAKVLTLLVIDVICINIAYLAGFLFRFGSNEGFSRFGQVVTIIPIFALVYVIPLYMFNMYKSIWRIAGIDEGIKCLVSCSISLLMSIVVNVVVGNMEPGILIVSGIIIFVLLIGARLSIRIVRRILVYGDIKSDERTDRVMIIGAGIGGSIVVEEMLKNKDSHMKPICIIDDNRAKKGKFIKGVKIEGTRSDIKKLVESKKITTILMAISSIDAKSKKEILEICQETKAKLKIVPGIGEILEGKSFKGQMRDVDLKDLLGREEIKLDKSGIDAYIKGKTVLVTGGGGSIGSELCRQIVKHNPKKLIILDIYENNAYDIQNELLRKDKNLNLRTIIASVRDKHRLNKIFKEEKINVVFHAAAHKHVPLMENNSEEAIKNNVLGTLNVAECADENGVERFVLISTDKAVNPTNIMGATKRLCEMIIQGINTNSKTEYVAVRFGNVLGSNGSVIPLFKNQIANGGPVTLTHKDITRYFMLIPEAAQLVLQAGAYASGGEIFVLDMGSPVKIYDLARKLIKLSGYEPEEEIKIEVTGLRPGEKLYEELLMSEEGLKETSNEKIFIGAPSEINFINLKKEIAEITMVALNKDKKSLEEKMRKIVTTYIEPGQEASLETASTIDK